MSHEKRKSFSGLAIVLLIICLIAVVGLSIALNRTVEALSEKQAPVSSDPLTAAPTPPSTSKPASASTPQRSRLDVLDVGKHARNIAAAEPTSGLVTRVYYRTPFASVHLDVLGNGQMVPLHMDRSSPRVFAVVEGTPTVKHLFGRDGHLVSTQQTLEPGTVVAVPAFSGQEWTQPDDMRSAKLVFEVPLFDGDYYVKPDNEDLAKGEPPIVLPPEQSTPEDLVVSSAGSAAVIEGDGRFSTRTIKIPQTIGPFPGDALFYIAKGKGTAAADGAVALHEHVLGIVSGGSIVKITPEAEAPLVMLLFRPQNDGLSDILKKGRPKYSQRNEESVIREFFQDRKNGIFLDVGAAHYKELSTTFYLEKHLGWTGVSVDALEEYAADYKKHRPGTQFVNYLVTDATKEKRKFYRSNGLRELSSVSKDVAQGQAERANLDGTVTELEVPTITLTDLLDGLDIEKIDFLSMDIEEHEPKAPAGFDIDRFKPELVCIEAHAAVRKQLLDYFAAHNYERIIAFEPYDKDNWYFTPRGR